MKVHHVLYVCILIAVSTILVGDLTLLMTSNGAVANLSTVFVVPLLAGALAAFLNKIELEASSVLLVAMAFVIFKIGIFLYRVSDPLLGAIIVMVAIYLPIAYICVRISSSMVTWMMEPR